MSTHNNVPHTWFFPRQNFSWASQSALAGQATALWCMHGVTWGIGASRAASANKNFWDATDDFWDREALFASDTTPQRPCCDATSLPVRAAARGPHDG